MTLCILALRAGVAIDMLKRFPASCAYVTKSTKQVLWVCTNYTDQTYYIYRINYVHLILNCSLTNMY